MNKNHIAIFILMLSIAACKDAPNHIKKAWAKINYKEIVASVKKDSIKVSDNSDSSNIFDENEFDPQTDSIDNYLDTLNIALSQDSLMVKKLGVNDSGILENTVAISDVVANNPNDTFTNKIDKIKVDEIKALKFNLDQIRHSDSIEKATSNPKKQIERRVWARINKTDQRLYLYVDGALVDTFKVSTGDTKHETPLMDRQPSGPIFQKYTSKKYPGGNYNGLGNMPYVVFVRGGYGLHGTTKGNIPKLGKKASHGCIRLHPDNAKIFNELVRKVGLNNTWVTIEK